MCVYEHNAVFRWILVRGLDESGESSSDILYRDLSLPMGIPHLGRRLDFFCYYSVSSLPLTALLKKAKLLYGFRKILPVSVPLIVVARREGG